MKKYWHIIGIGVQNNLTYRFNFLARTLIGFIPLTAILLLWRTIYSGKPTGDTIGGFTLAHMISYYLLAMVIDAFTAVNEDDWQIAADIKDGNISQFLLKPVDYLWFRFCLFLSGRATYLSVAFIPIAIVVFALREHFILPEAWETWLAFGISVTMTALLQFFLSYAMAMLAFWVMEVSTFIFILYALEYIASGHMFPLDILPPVVREALFFTPFPYQLYFPAGIFLGKIGGSQLVTGLIAQAGWVAAAYLLARFAWYRGIRKYAAAGG